MRTLAHFRRWAAQLRLDTGKHWRLEPFQAEFISDLFAGRSENWLLIPEGNAKTTLVAGLSLYHLQHTLDASIAAGAASREQAGQLYEQAEGFIARAKDDGLEDFAGYELHPGYRRIEFLPNRSKLHVKAADADTGDGIIPTLVIIDELHRHKNLKLYRTWRGKLGKRGGQMIVISTAGEPGTEFEEARERIRQEAPDVTRRACFTRAAAANVVLHDWAVPEDGDPEDLDLVKKANPLKAVTKKTLHDKRTGPGMTLSHWRRFTCNLADRGESAAIGEKQWADAAINEPIPEGQPIWLGLDVAWKWDTTAAVPFWLRDMQHRQFGPAMVFVPPRDGSLLDPAMVKRGLVVIHQRNPIHTVVMDMAYAADLAAWIEETLRATVIDRSQSPAAAVEDYERFTEALGNGWLKHAGDVALTRHVMNAVVKATPYGDTRFDRPSQTRQGGDQERRVIDALTAAAMVHTEASRAPVDDEVSVYAEDARRILI